MKPTIIEDKIEINYYDELFQIKIKAAHSLYGFINWVVTYTACPLGILPG